LAKLLYADQFILELVKIFAVDYYAGLFHSLERSFVPQNPLKRKKSVNQILLSWGASEFEYPSNTKHSVSFI
jgi:hypothetical protein